MKLQFTPHAINDLKRLRAFIAEQNPAAAQRMIQQLKQSIGHLAKHPELGKALEELPVVRDLVTGAYLVRYTATKQTIIVLKIWHGKEKQ